MTTRRSRPVTVWPVADRTAWAEAFRDDDLFEAGPGTHLAASSRATLAHAYGRWLAAIGTADPDSLSLAAGARVTRERVKDYVRRLRDDGVSERTIADYIDRLRRITALIDPDVPLDWIADAAHGIRTRVPLPDKRDRLVPPAQMLALVHRLIVSGFGAGPSAAQDLRDGLILGLLHHRAPRLANLCAMTLDRHLHRTGSGGLLIAFAAAEMKGRRQFTFEVPDRLLPAFDHYLAKGRERIPGAETHSGLWPSRRWGGRCPDQRYSGWWPAAPWPPSGGRCTRICSARWPPARSWSRRRSRSTWSRPFSTTPTSVPPTRTTSAPTG